MESKKDPERSGDQEAQTATDATEADLIRCDGGADTQESLPRVEDDVCQLRIRNLGGINSAERSIPPGLSVLVGRNATNRSSFLRALAAGLGGQQSAARLKTDADTGSVEITIGEDTYTREYTRNGQLINKQGEPYTTESVLIDTFVALFADCPARRAVENDANLREVLMKPVDTAEIKTRISDLKRERSDLDETIQQAEARKKELPKLEEQRTSLKTDLDEVEAEIADLESVVEELESTADESSETADLRSDLETLRNELGSAEQRADEINQQLEFRRKERSDLIEERDEIESKLEEFDESTDLETKISDLESDITQLADKRQTLNQAIEDLQSVIQANETFLDGDIGTAGLVDDGSVTAALDPDSQTIECWTCGTEVQKATIDERIGTLREIAAQQRTEINEIEGEIADLKREKASYEDKLEEYEDTTRRLGELDNRIDQHAEKIQELEADYEDQQAEIERLNGEITAVEKEIEATETDNNEEANEFVDAYKQLTKLERERGRLENQLEDITDRIEEIEALDEKRAQAETQREQITDELEELRGRIDRLEAELVETLNSIMEELIDRLEYNNIARVWLERQVGNGGADSSFKLNIVREAADGSVYEDSAETLSESEREVLGLVVSLAGYLVYEVDRDVPFLLLDSVEMIDGKRLANLLDYMQTKTDVDYLTVALLPKDAQSVEETGVFDEISMIDFEATPA